MAENGERQGIQSLVVGARLLKVLAQKNAALPLMTLAKEADMAPAKAHRYLAGYIIAGLIHQNQVSGHYDLGPLALDMGLAALRRLDVVELSYPVMEDLRNTIGETVSMTVWGNRGPTLVRWVSSNASVNINVNVGSVLPLVTSSNGRIFAAYLPWETIEPLVLEEMADPNGGARRAGFSSVDDLCPVMEGVRENRMSHSDGLVLPGICSISAPIFNHSGAVAAALTVVGICGIMDVALDSAPAVALRSASEMLSTRMGFTAAPR